VSELFAMFLEDTEAKKSQDTFLDYQRWSPNSPSSMVANRCESHEGRRQRLQILVDKGDVHPREAAAEALQAEDSQPRHHGLDEGVQLGHRIRTTRGTR
jgi:hypothetical protein